jgi:hypothetical protein
MTFAELEKEVIRLREMIAVLTPPCRQDKAAEIIANEIKKYERKNTMYRNMGPQPAITTKIILPKLKKE